ncbi:hypothetical protein [Novosphingobium sp. RL4]|uniref:hypothetical protein n=1 Tax=Novosphingobium sp. RL4 TaxID=3109595 RepID=UPI002D791BBB|nr:hypothetical protein [Novosphingobium sp. RL4]WRT91884.1 hypothetical protein U9J33_11745 [Novosphingobium sp. RL4]
MEVYVSTTTKFTPGPWSASKLIGADDLGIVNSYGSAVARIGNLDIANPANAHLIAAAPELYEALLELAQHASHQDSAIKNGGSLVPFDVPAKIKKAIAALAKARGEVVS